MTRDNSTAMQEQEALLKAIKSDEIVVSISAATALGASLLAFNSIASKFGKQEKTPQEWAEQAIQQGLEAIRRTWEYSEKTRTNKEFANEMRTIAKLFHVPESTHPKYQERMLARFEAEQACRAKYGIQ
jgi:hypothetical protein